MAGIRWTMSLFLLMEACLATVGRTESGCLEWSKQANTTNVCCHACHPGNHLYKECGPNPKKLCIPCEAGKFTVDPKARSCSLCTACIGVQVLVKECNVTHNTVCGCKEGLICGDTSCSFCAKSCGKGEEPTQSRSCTPCPNGTFNDQIHHKCKPWRKTCPSQMVLGEGTAFTDRTCVHSHVKLNPGENDKLWTPVLVVSLCISLMLLFIIIIIIIVRTIKSHRRKKTNTITKKPIISTPTDDPRTLIAIECSFHEAEQEQGSSSESLFSNNSTKILLDDD